MLDLIRKGLSDGPAGLRGKIAGIYLLLVGANLAAWGAALVAFHDHPLLLGTALLAYGFGLRHAVDADHIAAIDNVTRKLMQEGKRPVAAGLYFSLGHSTVVTLASAAIAWAATAVNGRFLWIRDVGGTIGTLVSVLFLFAIALANMVILVGVYRGFRQVCRGGRFVEEDLDLLLSRRGILGRVFRPLFRLIGKSWHMYPLGFVFALGFDTATEIGLLGISAAEAAKGLSSWSLLVFPALFTAGMSLIDATDSIFMVGAYGWAFVKPIRKLYYNLTITFISVVAALVVGGVEVLGLVASEAELPAGAPDAARAFWDAVASLSDNSGMLGYGIIAIFAVSWVVALVVYRIKGYDRLEAKTGA